VHYWNTINTNTTTTKKYEPTSRQTYYPSVLTHLGQSPVIDISELDKQKAIACTLMQELFRMKHPSVELYLSILRTLYPSLNFTSLDNLRDYIFSHMFMTSEIEKGNNTFTRTLSVIQIEMEIDKMNNAHRILLRMCKFLFFLIF
jgi:hypothetical protein